MPENKIYIKKKCGPLKIAFYYKAEELNCINDHKKEHSRPENIQKLLMRTCKKFRAGSKAPILLETEMHRAEEQEGAITVLKRRLPEIEDDAEEDQIGQRSFL